MIKPGLVSATFKSLEVERVIALALKAGLKAIEWSENHHLPLGDVQFSENVGKLTRLNGLEIATYGSYYRLGEGMDIIPSLENARALGSSAMRIWAGRKASWDYTEDERAALVDELKKAVETASGYGIKLVTEWHKNTLTDTNDSGIRLLEEVPGLGTLWQPTQALGFEERLEGLEKVSSRLENLHVYYWDESGRRPFSEGIEHWKKYLDRAEGHAKYALLEFVKDDSEEQFLADADCLLRLLGDK